MKFALLLSLLLASQISFAQTESVDDSQTGCILSLGFLQKNSFISGEATAQLRQYTQRRGAAVDKKVLTQLQDQADNAAERASIAAERAREYCVSNK